MRPAGRSPPGRRTFSARLAIARVRRSLALARKMPPDEPPFFFSLPPVPLVLFVESSSILIVRFITPNHHPQRGHEEQEQKRSGHEERGNRPGAVSRSSEIRRGSRPSEKGSSRVLARFSIGCSRWVAGAECPGLPDQRVNRGLAARRMSYRLTAASRALDAVPRVRAPKAPARFAGASPGSGQSLPWWTGSRCCSNPTASR
jgi:hypothetical protein